MGTRRNVDHRPAGRWPVRLVVCGLAASLLLAFGGAAAASEVRQAAADPIIGSWLFTSRRGDLQAVPSATVVAAGDGFDVVTGEGFKSGAPGGVTFSVLERASAFDDNAQCTIGAGTVVVHLRATGVSASGERQYKGQVLTAQVAGSPSTCVLVGLQGTYYARLVRWEDLAQKPPLADGPSNRICISDSPGGCYVSFDRKGGTAPPVSASPTTTTSKPSPPPVSQPVKGLAPNNPKIPRVAAFKNDRTPPTVRAVASSGLRGRQFFLDYYSKDERGFAGETYQIYRGAVLVKSWSVLAGERDGRLQRGPAVLPANVSGKLTFCVGAQDLNGNRSPWSCAPLTIS